MANSTAKSENPNDNESDEEPWTVEFLAYKIFGIVRMPQLKMQENVPKPKETATVHARKHLRIGTKLGRKWPKQAICCLKVALIRSLSIFKGLSNQDESVDDDERSLGRERRPRREKQIFKQARLSSYLK